MFFDQQLSGIKRYELRVNDRGFKVGDQIRLIEVATDNDNIVKILRSAHADIVSIIVGYPGDGYVILGTSEIYNYSEKGE